MYRKACVSQGIVELLCGIPRVKLTLPSRSVSDISHIRWEKIFEGSSINLGFISPTRTTDPDIEHEKAPFMAYKNERVADIYVKMFVRLWRTFYVFVILLKYYLLLKIYAEYVQRRNLLRL